MLPCWCCADSMHQSLWVTQPTAVNLTAEHKRLVPPSAEFRALAGKWRTWLWKLQWEATER